MELCRLLCQLISILSILKVEQNWNDVIVANATQYCDKLQIKLKSTVLVVLKSTLKRISLTAKTFYFYRVIQLLLLSCK